MANATLKIEKTSGGIFTNSVLDDSVLFIEGTSEVLRLGGSRDPIISSAVSIHSTPTLNRIDLHDPVQTDSTLVVGSNLDISGSITFTGGEDRNISLDTAHLLSLRTDNIDRLRILPTGQVGIGQNYDPGTNDNSNIFALDVDGDIHAAGDVIMFSDARYKTNIEPLEDVLQKIGQMKGVTYEWIKDQNEEKISRHLGLLAQDVKKAFPEAVSEDSVTSKMSVAYPNLVGALVSGINLLAERLEDVEARIMKLEGGKI